MSVDALSSAAAAEGDSVGGRGGDVRWRHQAMKHGIGRLAMFRCLFSDVLLSSSASSSPSPSSLSSSSSSSFGEVYAIIR